MKKTARIEWEDEFIEIDDLENPDIGQLETAMRFKAEHIKAKADPQLFECVADTLNDLTECIFKGAYLKRGHWIINDVKNVYGGQEITCSECEERFVVSKSVVCQLYDLERYCRHCGANMRVE